MYPYRLIYVGLFCVSLLGCGRLFQKPVTLCYTVRVTDTATQAFDVELLIQGAPTGTFVMRAYTFEEYTEIERFEARHHTGIPLQVDHTEERQRVRDQPFTDIFKVLNNPDGGDVKVSYRVRVGTNYAPHSQQPDRTHGYMCDSFALVSGRNLFFLPEEGAVGSVRVQFEVPEGWQVAVPWEELGGWFVPAIEAAYLREELVNTSISLGFLEQRTERIGNTDVSVSVFGGWEKVVKDSIYQTAFSIYRSVANLFGGDGGGRYLFSFVPETHDGLAIYTGSWSSSQGSEMSPPTSARWLACTEKLIDRWIVYPPFHMTYDRQEDFWILDGIRRYCAIRIGETLGWSDGSRYLELQRRKFVRNVALREMPNPLSPMRDISLSRKMDVRKLYPDDSTRLKRRREQIAPTVLAFLDEEINKQSGGKYDFGDVLKYQYTKRQGLSLRSDIEAVAGDRVARSLIPYLHDISKVARKMGMVEPIPSHPVMMKEDIDPEHTDTLRVLLTASTDGFIEQCGCKVNQSGGVARRATVIAEIRKQFPEVLLVDAGKFFTYIDGQYQLTAFDVGELRLYLATMEKMGYDLAAVSFNELFYGSAFFQENASSVKTPFICANVLKGVTPIARPYVSFTVGKYRIGLLGVFQLSPVKEAVEHFLQDRTADLAVSDPVETIRQYLPQLRSENDLVVIIGNLEPRLIRKQVTTLEGIDIVISNRSTDGRLFESEKGLAVNHSDLSGFQNGVMVIYPQARLYGIELFEILIDRETRVVGAQGKLILLDDHIEDDPAVRAMLDDHYSDVITADINPLMSWNERFAQADYVGAETCQACHPTQYTHWQTTSHAFAVNSLLDAHRQYHPKCVVCHVTGAGYKSGYKMGDLKHPLINVQCEACHGPGGEHIEQPDTTEMIHSPSVKLCITCHNKEHSDFDFAQYYPKVRH